MLRSWLTTFLQRWFVCVTVGQDHLPVTGFTSWRTWAASQPSGSGVDGMVGEYRSMARDLAGRDDGIEKVMIAEFFGEGSRIFPGYESIKCSQSNLHHFS